MTSSKHTLIFDLDGTLIDSSASILAGFSLALAAHKITPSLPLTAEIIGPPLRTTLSLLADSQDELLLEKLAASFKKHYDNEGYKATHVFPGIDETLRSAFKRGTQLHLATNKRLFPTQQILQHLGWQELFTSVYAQDSKNPAFKNKAAMLSQLLQEQNIDVRQAVYIGDRLEDGEAADANSLRFVAVNWGYSAFSKDTLPAHWKLIETPGQLLQAGA